MSITFKTTIDIGEVEVTCTLTRGEAAIHWDPGTDDVCNIELVMLGGIPLHLGELDEEQLDEIVIAAFKYARAEMEDEQ